MAATAVSDPATFSDAEVFGAQAPAAAPQPVAQAGNGSVVDAPTGAALNPAQTARYQALLAAGMTLKSDPADGHEDIAKIAKGLLGVKP